MDDVYSKRELFETTPIPKAVAKLAIPTVISQLVNLIYNVVDSFFIGRTGDSYKTASVALAFTIFMMTIALSNLFGVGGGSLIARLSGRHDTENARKVSAFSFYGAIAIGLLYSILIAVFLNPLLRLLGASDATIGYARQYVLLVVIIGSVPTILTLTLGHLLRNVGYSKQASIGMSSGGILNIVLDPIFMFVIFPDGMEVFGAALATLVSNTFSCIYLFIIYKKVATVSPLSTNLKELKNIRRSDIRVLFSVGIPSAILTGLLDIANIFLNALMASHGDLQLAAIGIVMKADRLPNAINIGICQAMLPMVAYNYASGNHKRMNACIKKVRYYGLGIALFCLVLYQIFATPISKLFMSTSGANVAEALTTIGYATMFIRFRCLASPFQFLNYHSSFCLQAMGDGRDTLIHSVVRELVLYVPIMFLMNALLGETGLSLSFTISEFLGGLFALLLLYNWLKKTKRIPQSKTEQTGILA